MTTSTRRWRGDETDGLGQRRTRGAAIVGVEMIVEHINPSAEIDFLVVIRDGFDRSDVEPDHRLHGDDTAVCRLLNNGAMVGIELRDASAWSPAAWWTLPNRSDLPRDLFDAVAEWLGARERMEGER